MSSVEYSSDPPDIITKDDRVLVTGAAGFIGSRVVEHLLALGFRNVRCFVRPSSNLEKLQAVIQKHDAQAQVELFKGNLLSKDDCQVASNNVSVIYHLAAGTGDKSFPNAFMNSVVTTRNLLDAVLPNTALRRFVSISSFTVYTNRDNPRGKLLDETCSVEERPELRGDAYCFAKLGQDQLVMDYGKQHNLPYVILRPGVVYGPGKTGITTGRVGIGTFGLFLHLAGPNLVPFTYVENCAEAIVLAGIKHGLEGEILNIVDDDLPSSRQFLRLYKQNVKRFKSVYVPHLVSYVLCYLWEKYSDWSQGQLPPVYTRKTWHAFWKGSTYSNDKLKRLCGWEPKVTMSEGLRRYFESCREAQEHA